MADRYAELTDWAKGVVTANEADRIPINASSKAWNTALRSVGHGQAVMGIRPGIEVVNTSAISGTPIIHRMSQYNYDNSGVWTKYLAVFGDNGSLRFKQSDDTLTSELTPPANFPYTSGHCFASGDYAVDTAVAGNRLFCVNTNGERRSVLNQTYKAFGLEPIATVAVTAQSGGSSSMPQETYGVAVTSYDSATGAESSRGDIASVTTSAGADRIRVVITPTSAETAQYSHWRVYLRRNTTQPVAYQVQVFENSGGTGIVTDGNIPIATTTVYIDLTSAQIADHIIVAPNATENDPPPTSIRYVVAFGGRLIAADARYIYWSKLNKYDAFPPENAYEIAEGSGQEIRGLKLLGENRLAIFTSHGISMLDDTDPTQWNLQVITKVNGAVGHLAMTEISGGVAFWDTQHGPALLLGTTIQHIGWEKLGPPIVVDGVEQSEAGSICCALDPQGQRLVYGCPSTNATRNDFMLPFSLQVGEWESSKWDPIDAASMCVGFDSNGQERLFFGGYEGQLFKLERSVKNDAVPSGTVEGTFVASGTSQSTITSSGFYTTGAGLAERKITVVDNNNKPVGRFRISSNTSTVLTLASSITGLVTGATYTFYVGGADFRLYTKWIDMDQPFISKRFDRLYLQARAPDETTGLLIATQVDFIENENIDALTVDVLGDTWDASDWDSAYWSGQGTFKRRLPLFTVSTAARIGILHFTPNKDLYVLKMAVLARMLSERDFG